MRRNLSLLPLLTLMMICLSSCKSQSIPEKGLLEGEPCGPPCFFEVIPGVSNSTDVRNSLEKYGFIKKCEEQSYEELEDLVSIECRNPSIRINISKSKDTVESIAFWPTFTTSVGSIISRYGSPDFITCYSMETTPEYPNKSFSLFYRNLGMMITIENLEDNVANVQATTTIDNVVYSPSLVEEEAKGAYIQLWNGYGDYKPNP